MGSTVVMTFFVVVGTVRVVLDVVETELVDVLGLNVVTALFVVGKLVVILGTCEAAAGVEDPLQAFSRSRRCLNNIFLNLKFFIYRVEGGELSSGEAWRYIGTIQI